MIFKLNSTLILAFTLSLVALGQSDSAEHQNVNDSLMDKKRLNVISLEAMHLLVPIQDGNFGFGLNYERLIKDNKSIVFTTTGMRLTNESNTTIDRVRYITYNKISYRFYLGKRIRGVAEIDGKTYLTKGRDKSLLYPSGFYIGPTFSLSAEITEYPASDNFGQEYNSFPYFYHFDIGIGGCFGYQLVISKRAVLNLTLPITVGVHHIYDKDYDNNKYNKDTDLGVFPMINLNLGVAF